jgi:hypothetical protein
MHILEMIINKMSNLVVDIIMLFSFFILLPIILTRKWSIRLFNRKVILNDNNI